MSDQLGKSLQYSVNQKFGRGTYRVIQPIKRGKDGYVYKIQFIKQQKFGALKVLPKSLLNIQIQVDDQEQYRKKYKHDANLSRKAQNQIKLHSSLRSSYIVKLQNWSSDDMNFYLVLQYISKGDLGDQIRSSKTGLHINRIKKIGLQLAKGIDTIHKKSIVHRDIKPQNILLTEQDEIKICDFSCASEFNPKKSQSLQGAIGTLQYMAPEILGKYDNTVDVWSYGCVLFAMATGRVPFKLDNYVLGQYIKKVNQSSIKKLNKNMNKFIMQNSNKNSSKYSCLSNNCNCANQQHQQCYKKLANLLRKILVMDTNNRICLAQIIKHPFFTGEQLQQVQNQDEQKYQLEYQNKQSGKQLQKYLNPGHRTKIGTQQNEQNPHNQYPAQKIKNKNPSMEHQHTHNNQSKKNSEKQYDTKTVVNRPKTSYSLQSMKKYLNIDDKQRNKQDKKNTKTTHEILQKHKEKYNVGNNLVINSNKNGNQNMERLSNQQMRKSKYQEQVNTNKNNKYLSIKNDQNINTLNQNPNSKAQVNKVKKSNTGYVGNNYPNYNSKQSDIEQLIKHKLSDKHSKNQCYSIQLNNKPINPSKYISDHHPHSHPHSIYSSQASQSDCRTSKNIEPLNCEGLHYSTQLNCQQIVTIDENGLKGQFVRSGKSMLISPRGGHITVRVGEKFRQYELERLPDKYMRLYKDYKMIVDAAKKIKNRNDGKNHNQNKAVQHQQQQEDNQHYDQQHQMNRPRMCKTSRQKLMKQSKNEERAKSINKFGKQNNQINVDTNANINKDKLKILCYTNFSFRLNIPSQLSHILNNDNNPNNRNSKHTKQHTLKLQMSQHPQSPTPDLQLQLPPTHKTTLPKNPTKRDIKQSILQLLCKQLAHQSQSSSQIGLSSNKLKQLIVQANDEGLEGVVEGVWGYLRWFGGRPGGLDGGNLYSLESDGKQINRYQDRDLKTRNSHSSQNKYNAAVNTVNKPQGNPSNKASNRLGISRQIQDRQRLQRQRERYQQYNHRLLLQHQAHKYR